MKIKHLTLISTLILSSTTAFAASGNAPKMMTIPGISIIKSGQEVDFIDIKKNIDDTCHFSQVHPTKSNKNDKIWFNRSFTGNYTPISGPQDGTVLQGVPQTQKSVHFVGKMTNTTLSPKNIPLTILGFDNAGQNSIRVTCYHS